MEREEFKFNGRTDGTSQASVVEEALAAKKKADDLRAAAIARLLSDIEEAQKNLKALGYEMPAQDGEADAAKHPTPSIRRSRFSGKPLAEVGKAILLEYGQLHGKEIERIARQGGLKSASKKFQTYLRLAFTRAGGLENIGGNVWKLSSGIPATRIVSTKQD